MEDLNYLEYTDIFTEAEKEELYEYCFHKQFMFSKTYEYRNGCLQLGINPPTLTRFERFDENTETCLHNWYNKLCDIYQLNLTSFEFKIYICPIHLDKTQHWPKVGYISNGKLVATYFTNNNDGELILFNEKFTTLQKDLSIYKRISAEKGKVVIFDADRYYSFTSPTNENNIMMQLLFQKDMFMY